MISFRLFRACLLWGGVTLFVVELLWYTLEKKLGLLAKLPRELLEEDGCAFFIAKFISQFAFLVVLPAVVYSWFYVMVPFYGYRAGIAAALFLFLLGIVPFSITLLMRVKLPLSYTLFQMAGYLIKLILIYAVIATLYTM